MDFDNLEAAGKTLLEKHPVIKRSCKRVYQLCMYGISRDKIKSEGDMVCVSPNDSYEYSCGYYDKIPWDADDRYLLCLRVRNAYKSVAPPDEGELLLIDTKKESKPILFAKTHSWNVQQGCRAQWLGPDFGTRIIYNDFRDGRYCSVVFNRKTMREERVYNCAVYDVARDGSYALSLDFSRLHRLRPGYGYSNLPDLTKGELCPDKPCIWKLDLATGSITALKNYTDFANFEPSATMQAAEHKVNHIMISPDGRRFMVLHRWFYKGRKHTRLITMNSDGSGMYNLSDNVFASHCYWKNNEEILSFLRKPGTGDHYYLMKDQFDEYRMLWPELNTDGHCSYSSDGNHIITDTYPDRKRLASVYACIEGGGEYGSAKRIARVFAPFRYDNDTRCDLHPRWNHAGNMVCIDSVHEGRRKLYVIPIQGKSLFQDLEKNSSDTQNRFRIVYLVTNCKKTGPINQTLNIIKYLDRGKYEPVLVSLFPEDENHSLLLQYQSIVNRCYCLNLDRKSAVIYGKTKLNRLFEKLRPDCIHAVGMPLYNMSLSYRKAVHFVTLRNYIYDDYPDKYGRALGTALAHRDMAIIRKQVKRGETFVTCSHGLSKIYKIRSKMKFEFIRNGVDISKYSRIPDQEKDALKKKLGLPEGKIIFIYTGQFINRKDQQFALKGVFSAGLTEDFLFVLLGDGPNLKPLKDIYSANKQVIFTGNVSNVNEYLQAADLYLSTSKSEGMPNGVLEAMASGLPVLLSDIPQHKEILEIDPAAGVSYEIGDMVDFTQKLRTVLQSDLKAAGNRACKLVAENLTAEIMSRKYQNLYLRLMGQADEKQKA